MGDERAHDFGGDWTEVKLNIIARYLVSYHRALKNQRFRKWYIDAFAGTGFRIDRTPGTRDDHCNHELFKVGAPESEDDEKDQSSLLDGSARKAVSIHPPFDRYIFIEKNLEHCCCLEDLRTDFPHIRDRIDIRLGDANREIIRICDGNDWRYCRAVMFLDPFGLQVKWSTIEAIAETKAVDLWILFSCSAVNRMIPRNGKVREEWSRKLDDVFGTSSWRDELISTKVQQDLFGDSEPEVFKEPVEAIGLYFVKRLESIFAGVAKHPRALKNRRQSPMFQLCFAAANEKGAGPAIRIAEHLLKEIG